MCWMLFNFFLMSFSLSTFFFFFFFNDTATTEIYTLSLHDALPISFFAAFVTGEYTTRACSSLSSVVESLYSNLGINRSEEHTSELQSQSNLVCRLLLEKKKSHIYLIDVAPAHVRHVLTPLIIIHID